MTDTSFKILSLLAERGPMRANLIAVALNMPVASVGAALANMARANRVMDSLDGQIRKWQITDAGREALRREQP